MLKTGNSDAFFREKRLTKNRIGVSADGRMSKDPIAANMPPVLSRDVSGPMAALNSYLKLSTDFLE